MRLFIICLLFAIPLPLTSCKKSKPTITIGYQSMANPWKVLIAEKAFNKHTKANLDFRKFDSGGNVITAMASGSLDIAVLGSSPAATAISRGIDLRVVWIMEVIGDSEALVARNGTGITGVKALI